MYHTEGRTHEWEGGGGMTNRMFTESLEVPCDLVSDYTSLIDCVNECRKHSCAALMHLSQCSFFPHTDIPSVLQG